MPTPFAGVLDPGRREGPLRLLAGEAGAVDEVSVALDGGIYNLAELGERLGLDRTADRASVLARAYRRWGEELPAMLRGEFVLLLWDERARRGLLVPDQLGVRRPVIRRDGRRLWFATEVRPLLAMLPSRPGPDPVAVSAWLTGRPAPGGATLYSGVECPGPGRLVELDLEGGRVRRYWRPVYREPPALARDEAVARIRAALETAVARRTDPAAPTGVLLSGGLDSTGVAALASRSAAAGVVTYSATFPDHPLVDESGWIEAFTSALDLPGVTLAAEGRGILASGLEYLDAWQLPLHGWSEAWTQPLLRRAADAGVTVMLSGEGGDELFGSRLLLTADLLRRARLLAAVRYARTLPEAGGRAPRRVLARVLWEFGLQGVPPRRLEPLWRATGAGERPPAWASPAMAGWLRAGREPSWREFEGPRWWAHLSHGLTEGVHGYGVLDHIRRRSDQAGIEARQPLLDLDLFELMLRVPPRMPAEGRLTRSLQREALAGTVPDVVRLRRDKSRFDELVTGALLGPELPALRELLAAPLELGAYARPAAVAELVERPPPRSGLDPGAWGEDVLRLAAVELWLRSQGDPELPRRLLASGRVPGPRHRIEVRGARPGGRAAAWPGERA